jgi:hypothetical protein
MIAVLAALYIQATPARISYTNPGARLEVILQELSKLTGEPLAAGDSLKNLAATIRVEQVDLARLEKALADTFDGRWSTSSGKSYLNLDPERRRQRLERLANEKQKARLKDIRGFLDRAEKSGPLERAEAALVQALGPEELARLDVTYSAVYANAPHPLERPLPELDPAIFEALATAAGGVKIAPQDVPGLRLVVHLTESGRGDFSGQSTGQTNPLEMTVQVLSARGMILNVLPTISLDPEAPDDEKEDAPPRAEKGASVVEPSKPSKSEKQVPQVLWSKQAVALLGLQRNRKEPPPEVLKILLEPHQHDPAAFFGTGLVDWAAKTHRQLVAVATGELNGFLAPTMSADELQSELQSFGLRFEGDWALIGSHPEVTFATNIDHADEFVVPDGDSRFQKQHDDAAPSPEDSLEALRVGVTSTRLLFPNSLICFPNLVRGIGINVPFLELYETLSPTEISDLKANRRLSFALLEPAARQLLLETVFSGDHLVVGGNAMDEASPAEMNSETDPFEVAPSLAPAEANVRLEVSTKPAYQFSSGRFPRLRVNATDFTQLASNALRYGETLVQFGTVTTMVFHFHFCGKIDTELAAKFYNFPPIPKNSSQANSPETWHRHTKRLSCAPERWPSAFKTKATPSPNAILLLPPSREGVPDEVGVGRSYARLSPPRPGAAEAIATSKKLQTREAS